MLLPKRQIAPPVGGLEGGEIPVKRESWQTSKTTHSAVSFDARVTYSADVEAAVFRALPDAVLLHLEGLAGVGQTRLIRCSEGRPGPGLSLCFYVVSRAA